MTHNAPRVCEVGYFKSKKLLKMNYVLDMISRKKRHIEKVLEWAKYIDKPSIPTKKIIEEYKDQLFQLTKAELLLKENTGAITESAHFANTKLGEVPLQADSSETGSVRQNEQTGKVCFHCKSSFIGYNATNTEYRCGYCGCLGKPMDASAKRHFA